MHGICRGQGGGGQPGVRGDLSPIVPSARLAKALTRSYLTHALVSSSVCAHRQRLHIHFPATVHRCSLAGGRQPLAFHFNICPRSSAKSWPPAERNSPGFCPAWVGEGVFG